MFVSVSPGRIISPRCGSCLSHLERPRVVSSPLHADVKGWPLHLQFRAPQPGGALHTAAATRAIGWGNSSDAGLPQQEAESSCIQEARAVELHPAGRMVDGKSPGLKGGVGVGVDQREARAMDGGAIGRRAEVHKHACAAQSDVEGGPDTEPSESCRKYSAQVISLEGQNLLTKSENIYSPMLGCSIHATQHNKS